MLGNLGISQAEKRQGQFRQQDQHQQMYGDKEKAAGNGQRYLPSGTSNRCLTITYGEVKSLHWNVNKWFHATKSRMTSYLVNLKFEK